MNRTPPPRGSKRARTRARVVAAAGEVFLTRSLERATMEEIAERAGVSVGTLYGHFGSKDRLALTYLNLVFDRLDADIREAREAESPLARVLAAGDAYLQHVIDYPAAARLTSSRATYPTPEYQGEFSQALDRRMITTLMSVAADLKAAMDCGEIPRQPVDDTMIFLWGTWHGVATMVARGDRLAIPPETARRALDRGRTLLLAGINAVH